MTKVKLCGLSKPVDIEAANRLKPDYVGFVFAEKSKRYVIPEQALYLKKLLLPEIKAVGVFVNAGLSFVEDLLVREVIDVAQLHGDESEAYIRALRESTGKPIIKAFKVKNPEDVKKAVLSEADMILLDAGDGSGMNFDWSLVKGVKRPFFLAGGLNHINVEEALREVEPYGVDVSSGIETDGVKDAIKMEAFVKAVKKALSKDSGKEMQ